MKHIASLLPASSLFFRLQCLALLLCTLYVAQAQIGKQRRKLFNVKGEKLAILGYDPVSYFEEEAPVSGKPSISHEYKGILYYFSSEENKTQFQQNPAKYEPQFGGWCAYAMGAKGSTYRIHPKSYKIIDGKLYLFYRKTRALWNKREEEYLVSARKTWADLINKDQAKAKP